MAKALTKDQPKHDSDQTSPGADKDDKKRSTIKYVFPLVLALVSFLFVLGAILASGEEERIAEEQEEEKVAASQMRRVVVRKARPQAEVFKGWAPVGRLSEQIPATSRHCLDWWPEPPYTRADVAVFVKGKPYKHSDAPKEGLIVSGFYAQFQSTLEVPVPLNLVRYPMKKRKC